MTKELERLLNSIREDCQTTGRMQAVCVALLYALEDVSEEVVDAVVEIVRRIENLGPPNHEDNLAPLRELRVVEPPKGAA